MSGFISWLDWLTYGLLNVRYSFTFRVRRVSPPSLGILLLLYVLVYNLLLFIQISMNAQAKKVAAAMDVSIPQEVITAPVQEVTDCTSEESVEFPSAAGCGYIVADRGLIVAGPLLTVVGRERIVVGHG